MTKFYLIFLICTLLTTLGQAQLGPCLADTAFHIVVLGSSTAAGTGANPSDSAWVNRYRSYAQAVNPANVVTNLALGGYTTYHLLPTGQIPPSSRPAPDTARNITKAVSLQPDAIIVNLPSNDVSRGYTVAEQLANFRTIHATAQAANIPIWICTTQPKHYNSDPIPIQKQVDVRDSIWATYAPMVLDFWTGLADSTNQLDSTVNSGDGTHLNNHGHGILFMRVRDADLLGFLFEPAPYVDYALYDIILPSDVGCTNEAFPIEVAFFNKGLADSTAFQLTLSVSPPPGLPVPPVGLTTGISAASCETRQAFFETDASVPGRYEITAIISAMHDPNTENDTLYKAVYLGGFPKVMTIGDTTCREESLTLWASGWSGDSIRWYEAQGDSVPIWGGTIFEPPLLDSTKTYYAEAVRGPFFFMDSLSTTNTSNINWNGTMFDLVADTSLVLDSIQLKLEEAGTEWVDVYTRRGSFQGYETTASAWQLAGSFPVRVPQGETFGTMRVNPIAMAQGDTLGVYLQLQDPNKRLSYQRLSNPVIRSNHELRIITGAGVSHNFAARFFPRDWNGTIYYHFGERPNGLCQSARMPVTAVIGQPNVSLGQDTILNLTDSLLLRPNFPYLAYRWSTGSVAASIWLRGGDLGKGVFPIRLEVTDSLGCTASDTIIVVFAPLVGVDQAAPRSMKIWPVPARSTLQVELPQGAWSLTLLDMKGQVMRKAQKVSGGSESFSLSISDLVPGVYQLMAQDETGRQLVERVWVDQ